VPLVRFDERRSLVGGNVIHQPTGQQVDAHLMATEANVTVGRLVVARVNDEREFPILRHGAHTLIVSRTIHTVKSAVVVHLLKAGCGLIRSVWCRRKPS